MTTAYGTPVEDDDEWVAAKQQLYVAPSLTRIGAHARASVGTVSLVGLAITGVGLVSAQSVAVHPLPRTLAYAAAAAAFAALLLALSYAGLRLSHLNVENIDEVKAWYQRQFDRAWRVWLASWLLFTAVALGGLAAVASVVLSATTTEDPAISLVRTSGESASLTATVTVQGLESGDVVRLRVEGPGGARVLDAVATADPGSDVALEGSADVDAQGDYTVVVTVNGEERGRLESRSTSS